jgi:hypothetical protein
MEQLTGVHPLGVFFTKLPTVNIWVRVPGPTTFNIVAPSITTLDGVLLCYCVIMLSVVNAALSQKSPVCCVSSC